MKLDYSKGNRREFARASYFATCCKTRSFSIVLLGLSAVLSILILTKATAFFVASDKAEKLVEKAIAQSKSDANDVEKYLAASKAIVDELKKKNLFAPPTPKKHPVKQVLGIMGNEALINGKWYKVDDKVGDARIVAIEPAQVRIEWNGKEKIFAPINAASAPEPGVPKRAKPDIAEAKEPEREPVEARPMPGRRGMGRFRDLSPEERAERRERFSQMRERWENASEEEREEMRAEMRERFNAEQ